MQDDVLKCELSASEERKGDVGVVTVHIASAGEWPGSEGEANNPVVVPLNEIALRGVFEISNMLASPSRLEVALASVIELLQSSLQMRHGVVSLLADDDVAEIAVGAGWTEGSDERYRMRLPQKAIDEIVATGMPFVAEDVATHPAFSAADMDVLGAGDHIRLSFIGVPISVDGQVVGTLSIERVPDTDSMFPLDSDVRLLTMIANLIGQAVKLHRLVARDRKRLMAESYRWQKELLEFKQPARERKKVHIDGIIGTSPALRGLLDKIAVVAKSNATVLLRGESGTGKELVAKAIHELSPRTKRPFIKMNCAALPETVLESELFGHEKGAFTGAHNSRKGRFELADKGTLFLDEIGEISGSFQAKLLRVLQEQEFERVGSGHTIKVDVRVIAATNKDLEGAVAKNEFRADLYYRISVVPLLLPPLRERRSDIPLLATEFLKNFNSENCRTLTFDPSAMDVLMNCGFPGNVRELENCVQRTATLAPGPFIVRRDFACCHGQCLSALLWKSGSDQTKPRATVIGELSAKPVIPAPDTAASIAVLSPPIEVAPADGAIVSGAKLTDRERLIAAMEKAGWVQAKAARLLALTPRQIGYALRKYGIEIKRL
ncbi:MULTISPECIES: nif-specific transcriptional activator NifA [unclassified Bradyrhizobium]|uniref:nif-specific transcriptional activator NifA n=1 Tax=unclassified Bradyrhizobium TaxID=2631580 RepID=UPI0020B18CF8|nr:MULTISPECIES: nif-specific transcriptional activator NifA [unclassified Bradyrhizobium]MCP3380488.1 nif-specific transcriptional activator NifA [Bradyrhizobium sp. CCGUVB4N]MCP3441355.1 nif-specific transcriptional activator NifA [Bradyrhizobium sp. CCGUVB14]